MKFGCGVLFWTTILMASAGGAEYRGTPSNFGSHLTRLKPGDTLNLSAGTYSRMTIRDLHGTASAWIVIAGPPSGPAAVITGSSCCNTIEIVNSSFVAIENLTIDSKGIEGVFGISAKDGLANLTHDIRIQNDRFIGQGASQMTVAISTKTPTWGWIIRNNRISGAGTGIYLGNSDGTEPFIGGLIENNLIENTIGYNLEVKWQRARPSVAGMPEGQSSTIIRHNVFVHIPQPGVAPPRGEMIRAEPNLLVGGFPDRGAGASDMYQIYGNLFIGNLHEALLQASGRVSIHDNIFTGGDGAAVVLKDHDLPLKLVHIYNNTIYTEDEGISFGSPAKMEDAVVGNLIFAASPLTGPIKHASGNITDKVANAASYVRAPAFHGEMDFYPLEGKCQREPLDLSPFAEEADYALDFNGAAKESSRRIVFRGAYAGEGMNPGWKLQAEPKELAVKGVSPAPALRAAAKETAPAVSQERVFQAPPKAGTAPIPAHGFLEISTSAAKRGESGSFLIVLHAPQDLKIMGMQWELSSEPGVTIDPVDIIAGSAAVGGDKSLICSPMAVGAGVPSGERCVLVGGQKIVGNGPIAIVRYRVGRQVRAGSSTVRLEKAVAVGADLKQVDLGPAETALTIR